MRAKLTKRLVEAVEPTQRDQFVWDTELPGFGAKVTPKGRRTYLLQYSRRNRSRRLTIGRHGIDLTLDQARREAHRLRSEIALGGDPAEKQREEADQPTLEALAERYMEEHARPKKKATSVEQDEIHLRKHILPAMGNLKVCEIERDNVQRFHKALARQPSTANRCLALLSKMFNLAEVWELRADGTNPVRHVEKYREKKHERYLTDDELGRLGATLKIEEGRGANMSAIGCIRLLLLTGCRRNEILKLRWQDIDLERACLQLPDSKTGARTVPLSDAAIDLIRTFNRYGNNPYVFVGKMPGRHFVGIEKAWQRIREKAGLQDVRLHDLRHSFASTGAGLNQSLSILGSVLGHKSTLTTERYAHLADEPRRNAVNQIGDHLESRMNGIVPD